MLLDAYRKSRPGASPSDLYVAITSASMIGLGAITIAERKYAQHAAPVYMYIFVHESDAIVPGTQHKVGAMHALEIPYKFNNIQPATQDRKDQCFAARHEPDVRYPTGKRNGRA